MSKPKCRHGKWRHFRLVQSDGRGTLDLITLEYEGMKVVWWRCRVCGRNFPEEVYFFSGACMFGAEHVQTKKERDECLHVVGVRPSMLCSAFGSATEVTAEDIARGQPGAKCTFDAWRTCPLYLRNEARMRGTA